MSYINSHYITLIVQTGRKTKWPVTHFQQNIVSDKLNE